LKDFSKVKKVLRKNLEKTG